MKKNKGMAQLVSFFQKGAKEHPFVSIVILVVLAIFLFVAAVEAGESIGDSIWR